MAARGARDAGARRPRRGRSGPRRSAPSRTTCARRRSSRPRRGWRSCASRASARCASRASGSRAQTRPTESELRVLENVAGRGGPNGVRLYVTVMHPGSRTTPLTDEARSEFASYAAAIVREGARDPARHRRERAEPQPLLAPAVRARRLERGARGVSRAARADLRRAEGRLARRARLRRRGLPAGHRPAGRHPPDAFPHDVHPGARASRTARAAATRPVMDAFVDPRLRRTTRASRRRRRTRSRRRSASPTTTSSSRCSGRRSTGRRSAARRCRSSTASTASSRRSRRRRRASTPAPSRRRRGPSTEATQAAYYQQALALAFCQPNVDGMLLFPRRTSARAPAGSPASATSTGRRRAACRASREALDRTTGGSIARCPGVQLAVRTTSAPLRHALGGEARDVPRELPCDLDCVYEVRRRAGVDAPTKMVEAGPRRGRASRRGRPRRPPPRAGRVPLHAKLVHPVNPGPPTVRQGPVFRLP